MVVSESDLQEWVEGERRNIIGMADMLGVPSEIYSRDPMSLIPALQDYVSRAPLDEFEQSDWITLHADLMSYVADYLIQKHGARWTVADDPAAPRGYRCVIEAMGRDGQTRRIDPFDVVSKEFGSLPIEITRMLASAELTLRLASQAEEGE
ncbi:hypothetical protein ACFYOV_19660 [Streptomyces sp. NPDC005931]|uniref:hypothetical protein n=1 Tax=Streptomyces sp. NPDC005931 TaxID=3364737 RepID=UPI00369723B2